MKIRWISDCWIRRRWVLPVCIALVGLLLNIIVATYMAPCADESVHVYYAMQILKGNADRSQDIYFNSKMPGFAPERHPPFDKRTAAGEREVFRPGGSIG